jgi:hypothetical protein
VLRGDCQGVFVVLAGAFMVVHRQGDLAEVVQHCGEHDLVIEGTAQLGGVRKAAGRGGVVGGDVLDGGEAPERAGLATPAADVSVQLERRGEVLFCGCVVAAGEVSLGAVVEGERFAVAVPGAAG